MSKLTARLVGWGLIAAIAVVCFGLNQLRAQYLYFNWFVIFTFVASTLLVVALWFIKRRTRDSDPDHNETAM